MSDLLDDEFDDLTAAEIPPGRPAQPGDTITVAASGVTIHTGQFSMGGGVTLARGDHFTLTSPMIEASRDNTGAVTWPSIIHDEQAQRQKWGHVRFLLGRHDLEPWDAPGDARWELEHRKAMDAARFIVDADARAEALAKVRDRFGQKPLSTSYTVYRDHRAEVAAADAAALRQGLRGNYGVHRRGTD